jgi:hypothetical protein
MVWSEGKKCFRGWYYALIGFIRSLRQFRDFSSLLAILHSLYTLLSSVIFVKLWYVDVK